MIKIAELEIEEEYQNIYDDVLEKCKEYGNVLKMVLPKPVSG